MKHFLRYGIKASLLSLPTRERGLKLERDARGGTRYTVAPHAGAWIETIVGGALGLAGSVAPHAGAWIETANSKEAQRNRDVAPHAGAWIETLMLIFMPRPYWSLPTRERGLKHVVAEPLSLAGASLPTRERGLKLVESSENDGTVASLPTRERGLKLRMPTC